MWSAYFYNVNTNEQTDRTEQNRTDLFCTISRDYSKDYYRLQSKNKQETINYINNQK